MTNHHDHGHDKHDGHKHEGHDHGHEGHDHGHEGHGHDGHGHGGRAYPSDDERVFLSPFLDDVERFLVSALDGVAGPVVEIGAGDGYMAHRLRQQGFEVIAIDANEEWAKRSTDEGRKVIHADWLSFDGGPYERYGAAIFTMSLHHIDPIEQAVEQLLRLVPGGRVAIDDFGWERLDEVGAHLLMDSTALAEAAGLTSRAAPVAVDPLAAWHLRMGDEHAITRGDALIGALDYALDLDRVGYGRFIARFASQYLTPSEPAAYDVRDLLIALEDERLSSGALTPVGIRAVGDVPGLA